MKNRNSLVGTIPSTGYAYFLEHVWDFRLKQKTPIMFLLCILMFLDSIWIIFYVQIDPHQA